MALPFVLLLLDYWPLARFTRSPESPGTVSSRSVSVARLIAEKGHLFAISAAASMMTVAAYGNKGELVRTPGESPLVRGTVVVRNTATAMVKSVFPRGLEFYPLLREASSGLADALLPAALVGLAAFIALRRASRSPYLLVGFGWFMVTLIPTSGIIQIRDHAVGFYPSREVLQNLRASGLDEIRFHPPRSDWSSPQELARVLQDAKTIGLMAGVEIPALEPAPQIVETIREADAFLNINELEFSETNFADLIGLGFLPQDMGCAAEGSEEMAKENFLVDGLKVHYCPSRFKDAVQLRERLKRRAGNVARPFDFVTEDGTIIHGIISGNLAGALKLLEDLEVPSCTPQKPREGFGG